MANDQTPVIQVAVKSVVGGAVAFAAAILGGGWLVFSAVSGDVKQDVRDIRIAFDKMVEEDKTIRGRISGEEKDLTKLITDIAKTTAANKAVLVSIKQELSGLTASVAKIDERLTY